jgi:Cdc6-like AAA superfamily ATPase
MGKRNYDLVGQDGNAFALMGYTKNAMQECGRSKEQIDEVLKKAMSSDYNNLIVVLNEEIQKLNKGE